MAEEKIYSWEDINDLCDSLIDQINHEFDVIVPILRGGLIPGSMLAYRYFNKFGPIDIQPIIWQTRDNNKKEIEKLIDVFHNNSNILIMDDLLDSGLTFYQIEEELNNIGIDFKRVIENKWNINFAVLMQNVSAKYNKLKIGNIIAGEMIDKESDPRWIRFPWEN